MASKTNAALLGEYVESVVSVAMAQFTQAEDETVMMMKQNRDALSAEVLRRMSAAKEEW